MRLGSPLWVWACVGDERLLCEGVRVRGTLCAEEVSGVGFEDVHDAKTIDALILALG